MLHTTVAIIGMGPRGLNILERLIALYENYPNSGSIDVLIIEPNDMGTGVHSINQPDHLLLNTVACQITLFCDETMAVKECGPIRKGPNLHQWAIQQGYRNVDGTFMYTTFGGRIIEENEYLPRSLLGKYLNWVYRELLKESPPNIHIHEIHKRAINLHMHPSGKTDIILEGNSSYQSDFTYITTGHSKNLLSINDYTIQKFISNNQDKNTQLGYFPTPYPVSLLDTIQPKALVLIQGFGLTAYDILSQLTYGRGGKFGIQHGRLHYTPSGLEPTIALFSRQSLPFSSRGRNQKSIGGQYKPSFFTYDAIYNLRRQNTIIKGSHQLDFETQVLPLLLKEMSYVYRSTQDGIWQHPETYIVIPEDAQYIQRLISPLRDRTFPSLSDYTQFVIKYLKEDMIAAITGNTESPVKAATDILRDVRDILRYAIDFCGISAKSHKQFIEYFNPIFNRISVGPPLQRNEELHALIMSDVVTLAGGPGCTLALNNSSGRFEVHTAFSDENSVTEGDVLIKARIDSFLPLQDESPFIRNLIAQGIFRPFTNQGYHPSGIDVDQQLHPINSRGQVLYTIWALGHLVEGANFYTYVLPRPRVNSRALRDAGRCVIDMYQQLQHRRQ